MNTAWRMCVLGLNWPTWPAFQQNRNRQRSNSQEEGPMEKVMTVWIFVGLGVVGIMCLLAMLARLYRKVGPHEALIVYGFGGMHVIKEGGKVIFPMIQNWKLLSLELM